MVFHLETREAELFSVASKCFASVDEETWEAMTEPESWQRFLEMCQQALQVGQRAICVDGSLLQKSDRLVLDAYLSVDEVAALRHPPSFEEKQRFAAGHFTGGLPESVLPIESLYQPWLFDAEGCVPFAQSPGMYRGDSARYMREVIDRLGLEVPYENSACPDHLALELDLMAVLLRSGLKEQAQVFLQERFEWLTAYRIELLRFGEETRFYVGLIDVVLGISSIVDEVGNDE